jgi:hypothetical protein
MLLAAAAKAATEAHWWDDWLKFTPGWLAFIATAGTWIYKWSTRRHKLALGPDDDEARKALIAARIRFEEITSNGGMTASWFKDPERREIGRTVRDLAVRRKGAALKQAMEAVAASWDEVLLWSVPDRPLVHWEGREQTAAERAQFESDKERARQQVDEANRGWRHVETAINRLNELEQKTHGRS